MEQSVFQFPDDYGHYLDEAGVVKSEYLTDLPEIIAKVLEGECAAAREDSRKPSISMHQMRSFYGHAKRAEDAWHRKLPLAKAVNEIKKLVACANDRLDKKRITQTFHDFIRRNAESVKADDDGRSLTAFMEHFEALVGFCAGRLSERVRI